MIASNLTTAQWRKRHSFCPSDLTHAAPRSVDGQETGYQRFADDCRIAPWTVILVSSCGGVMVLTGCFMAWCKSQRRRRQFMDELSRRSAVLRALQLDVSPYEAPPRVQLDVSPDEAAQRGVRV